MDAPRQSTGPRGEGPSVRTGVVAGLLVGLVFGIIFVDSIPLGIALGIALAVAGGAFASSRGGKPKG